MLSDLYYLSHNGGTVTPAWVAKPSCMNSVLKDIQLIYFYTCTVSVSVIHWSVIHAYWGLYTSLNKDNAFLFTAHAATAGSHCYAVYSISVLLGWNRKASIFKNPINPRIITLRLFEGQDSMHVTLKSYLFHDNAGALFEPYAKITQKRKPSRKPMQCTIQL